MTSRSATLALIGVTVVTSLLGILWSNTLNSPTVWGPLAMLGALPPIAFAAARKNASASERWMAQAAPQAIGIMLVLALFATGFFSIIRSDTPVVIAIVALAAILLTLFVARQPARGKIFLGVVIGLASAALIFTACALWIISLLG